LYAFGNGGTPSTTYGSLHPALSAAQLSKAPQAGAYELSVTVAPAAIGMVRW
jgi:hypothetical protein